MNDDVESFHEISKETVHLPCKAARVRSGSGRANLSRNGRGLRTNVRVHRFVQLHFSCSFNFTNSRPVFDRVQRSGNMLDGRFTSIGNEAVCIYFFKEKPTNTALFEDIMLSSRWLEGECLGKKSPSIFEKRIAQYKVVLQTIKSKVSRLFK